MPGLSYYVRENGHVTGNIFEGAAEVPVMLDGSMELSDAQVDASLQRWIDFCVKNGVSGVFDAGIPGHNAFNERVYQHLRAMDLQGKLPVYVDGCYVISSAREVEEGLRELKRMNREYDTEHMKVHTLKIFIDGTLKLHTAAMVEPYADVPRTGITALNKEEFADLLLKLNEVGLDLHLHTVGDAASRVVLDGVELARKELGDSFRVKVTCAHLEIQDDADLDRFAKLGGEMISLTAVELRIAESGIMGEHEFAVTAVPDSAKGEKIVLLVKDGNAEEISRALRKSGIPPLMQPGAVFVVDNIPKLGSGKWDFNGMKKLALELVENKA